MRPPRLAAATPSPTQPPAHARPVARSAATVGIQSRCAPNTPDQACTIATSRVAGQSACSFSVSRRTAQFSTSPYRSAPDRQ